MNRTRVVKSLKITWTAFWGAVAVLLIVLWVRSYSINDIATYGRPAGPGYMFGSLRGELSIARFKSIEGNVSEGWSAWTHTADYRAWEKNSSSDLLGVRFGSFFVVMPYWILTFACTLTMLAPWIHQLHWRFSLRTLLIATALVALVLGLIVWTR